MSLQFIGGFSTLKALCKYSTLCTHAIPQLQLCPNSKQNASLITILHKMDAFSQLKRFYVSRSNFWLIKHSPLATKSILTNISIFLFFLLLKGPLLQTCIFFALKLFFFLLVCRMSHSKAFPQQSKPGRNSHSSNRYVSVVFAHSRNTEVGGREPQAAALFQQSLGSSPAFMPSQAAPYLHGRGLGRRGWWVGGWVGGWGGQIPSGLTQVP